jgi:hypothetical protein
MNRVETDLNVDVFLAHIQREMKWKQSVPMIDDMKDLFATVGTDPHLKN